MTDPPAPRAVATTAPPPRPGARAPTRLERRPARLRLPTLVLYSLPAVGVGYMFLLISLFLLKYATDVLLIAPAAMGAIFMAARVWDAFTDPLAGYLSDRTRTALGRRRPWLLLAAPPAGVTFVMLWSTPAPLSGAPLVAWIAAAVMLFYTAMTALMVPHAALGAELTPHYHDRNRVFGVRQVAWHLGVLGAVVSMYLLTRSESPRELAGAQARIVAVATVLFLFLAAAGLRERVDFQGRGGRHPAHAFRDVWRNRHARLLLFVFLIESTGGAVVGALTIYFSEYVLGTPELTPVYIAVYFVAATVSVPLWISISRRLGKKPLWSASMLATGAGFGSTFLLQEGDAAALIGIAALLGLAAGCGNMVGPSIQADVIDWDEYVTGERKEGAYFAAWNFVLKLATGCTLGLTGFVLQAAGYQPNSAQPEGALLAIRVLYGLFPLCCYAGGVWLFQRFSFNEAEHARVRRSLDERYARGPVRPDEDTEVKRGR